MVPSTCYDDGALLDSKTPVRSLDCCDISFSAMEFSRSKTHSGSLLTIPSLSSYTCLSWFYLLNMIRSENVRGSAFSSVLISGLEVDGATVTTALLPPSSCPETASFHSALKCEGTTSLLLHAYYFQKRLYRTQTSL